MALWNGVCARLGTHEALLPLQMLQVRGQVQRVALAQGVPLRLHVQHASQRSHDWQVHARAVRQRLRVQSACVSTLCKRVHSV